MNVALTTSSNRAFQAFRVFEGQWIAVMKGGEFRENWKWENDSLLLGTGCYIQHNDTLFSERIRLVLNETGLHYCALDATQNGGNEVCFPLKHYGRNKWVFELPGHDFPKRIIYTHPSMDSLHVWIEGEQNGKTKREDFHMHR
jgi:hypothetical protein